MTLEFTHWIAAALGLGTRLHVKPTSSAQDVGYKMFPSLSDADHHSVFPRQPEDNRTKIQPRSVTHRYDRARPKRCTLRHLPETQQVFPGHKIPYTEPWLGARVPLETET